MTSMQIKDKIAVMVTCNPFQLSQRLLLAEELSTRLKLHGHDSYVIKLPVNWTNGDTVMQSILSLRLMKIMNTDAVIAVDFPAAIVPHPNKYAWLTDTSKEIARSQYEAMLAESPQNVRDEAISTPHRLSVIQDLLEKMELSYLAECKKIIFCANALTEPPEQESQEILESLEIQESQKIQINGDDLELARQDTPDAKSNESTEITKALKQTLKNLSEQADSEYEKNRFEEIETIAQSNMMIEAFEDTQAYIKKLDWNEIVTYFTRSFEI